MRYYIANQSRCPDRSPRLHREVLQKNLVPFVIVPASLVQNLNHSDAFALSHKGDANHTPGWLVRLLVDSFEMPVILFEPMLDDCLAGSKRLARLAALEWNPLAGAFTPVGEQLGCLVSDGGSEKQTAPLRIVEKDRAVRRIRHGASSFKDRADQAVVIGFNRQLLRAVQ